MPHATSEQQADTEGEGEHMAAGLVRALRSLLKPARKLKLRSVLKPARKLKLPRARVGALANHGGNAFDTWQLLQQRAAEQERNTSSSIRKVFQREMKEGGMRAVMKHLALPLAVNTVLGTLMFDVYEAVDHSVRGEQSTVNRKGAEGLCAGLVAGGFFGGTSAFCADGIDRALGEARASRRRVLRNAVRAMAIEAPSTALWFGSYFWIKEMMFSSLVDDRRTGEFDALQLAVISTAGMFSGVLQATSSHVIEQGIGRQFSLPPALLVLRAVPMSILTFIALEYG
eukprot:TRINITY_DN19703_c0_g1_i2.p1 TRINITY_DN19703_c0_g1~~TRINITY_DN19703_c0_g1_i2.p1  ORF type:complete len:285 (+),score=65.87 TRINITY_DN19703_c0_g1_i2:184-1038(+)